MNKIDFINMINATEKPKTYSVPDKIEIGQIFSLNPNHAVKNENGYYPIMFPVLVIGCDGDVLNVVVVNGDSTTCSSDDLMLTDGNPLSGQYVCCWLNFMVSKNDLLNYFGKVTDETMKLISDLHKGKHVNDKNRYCVGPSIVHSHDYRLTWREWMIDNVKYYPTVER